MLRESPLSERILRVYSQPFFAPLTVTLHHDTIHHVWSSGVVRWYAESRSVPRISGSTRARARYRWNEVYNPGAGGYRGCSYIYVVHRSFTLPSSPRARVLFFLSFPFCIYIVDTITAVWVTFYSYTNSGHIYIYCSGVQGCGGGAAIALFLASILLVLCWVIRITLLAFAENRFVAV